jgi:hypothetical protein|tara:strand:+ start:104 stop:265 length:162 start_codon:yes stop_codon:yes gene_type:complete
MPKVGKEEFAYTPEGIAKAKEKSLETGIPMSNAQDRSETSPDTEKYDKGGAVK